MAKVIVSATLCRSSCRFGRMAREKNPFKTDECRFLNGRSAEPAMTEGRFFDTMTKTILTARCAPVAIAAILALSSTPALAQDAVSMPSAPINNAPPIMQSPVMPTPAPAPAPVPTPSTSPRFVSTPQVQTVPEPEIAPTADAGEQSADLAETTSPAAAATTSQPVRSAPANRTRAAAVAPAASSPASPAATGAAATSAPTAGSEIGTALPPFANDDPVAGLPSEPVETAQQDIAAADESSMIGLLAAGLVGLIPIGLAIAAVVWWRRRSRIVTRAPEPTVLHTATRPDPDPVRAPVAPRTPVFTPAATPRPATSTMPADTAPFAAGIGGVALAERSRTETRPAVTYTEPEVPADDVRPANREGVFAKASEQGRVAPAPSPWNGQVPADAEARHRMVERMVEADPDAANPFTSRKARRRRARLIMASHEGSSSTFGGNRPMLLNG